jgi:hypothetical protein
MHGTERVNAPDRPCNWRCHATLALLLLSNASSCGSAGSTGSGDASLGDSGSRMPNGGTNDASDGGGQPFESGAWVETGAPCSGDNTYCAGPGGEGLCCSGHCIVSLDPNNCGYCGFQCASGQKCIGGAEPQSAQCAIIVSDCTTVPTYTATNSGWTVAACQIGGQYGTCCGTRCVTAEMIDSMDAGYCGHCGVVCPTDSSCQGGSDQCVAGGGLLANCNGDSPANSCPSGLVCNGSTCVAPACGKDTLGYQCTDWDGSVGHQGICCGTTCVSDLTDDHNCGACGAHCPSGTTCNVGVCRTLCSSDAGCPSGTSCNGGVCF